MRAGFRDILIASPLPWLLLGDLVGLLGADDAAELAAAAQAEGLIVLWEAEGELRLTPTPLGAERLKIRLRNDQHWVDASKPDLGYHIHSRHQSIAELEHILSDPTPPASDIDVPYRVGLWRDPPYPAYLTGVRYTWRGPRHCTERPCPACGERLRVGEHCLHCSRSGPLPKRKRT